MPVGIETRIALLSLLLACGCATTSTWEETGRSRIQIADAEIAPCDGSAGVVRIFGKRTIPIVPFLAEWTSEGEVDSVPIAFAEGEGELWVADVEDLDRPAAPACGLRERRVNSVSDDKIPLGDRTLRMDAIRPLLLADLHRYRSYLAIPLAKETVEEIGDGRMAIFALRHPCISYRGNSYSRRETGVRVVTERILFIPIALALDVVTFPLAIPLLPFVHM